MRNFIRILNNVDCEKHNLTVEVGSCKVKLSGISPFVRSSPYSVCGQTRTAKLSERGDGERRVVDRRQLLRCGRRRLFCRGRLALLRDSLPGEGAEEDQAGQDSGKKEPCKAASCKWRATKYYPVSVFTTTRFPFDITSVENTYRVF